MWAPLARTVVVGVLVASGCGPAFQARLPDTAIASSRMEILPPVVREQELDTLDERTYLGEAKSLVSDNVKAEVDRQAQYRGARVFRPGDYGAMDPALRSLYNRLWRWTTTASMEIAAQKTGRYDFGRHSVGDWRFQGELAPLRAAWQRDTALAVVIHDTHESTGRIVLSGMAGISTHWKQIGVACLVSLVDGRMIWCNVRVDAWPDLRDGAHAQTAIYDLFSGLDAAPKPATK